MRKLFCLFVLAFLLLPVVASAGAVITYHGRILDGAGHPVESANVTFRIQILSPNPGKCLLYEEVRTISMLGSDGVFVIPIGDGAGSRTALDPGIVVEKVFVNDPSVTFNTTNYPKFLCNTGVSYTPDPLHQRQLAVAFDDHSGVGEQVLPIMDVNFVPFAVSSYDAQNLGGAPANSVLRLTSGTATPLSPASFTELNNLISGASTQYVQSGQEADPTVKAFAKTDLPTCGAGQVLKASGGVLSCVSGGGTVDVATTTTTGVVQVGNGLSITGAGLLSTDNATIKSSLSLAVSDITGLQTALDNRVLYSQMPTCTAGQVWTFVSPAGGFICTSTSISSSQVSDFNSAVDARVSADATKLPLSGGTMSGAINMNGQNLTLTGFITMSSSKSLHLSNNATDPVGLVAADKGKVWFNSSSNEIKYWDGSQAKTLGTSGTGLQSLNGLSDNSQTFATGSSGSDFNISSASGVHTLNIPTASASNRGLLSSTDWSNFNNRLTAITSANSYLSITGTSAPIITANIGTTANTLAAGNDTRITGALQTSGGSMTGQLNLAVGTTSIVPIRIPIGTLISGPVAGGIENDGTSIYWTNNVLNRQKFLTYPSASTPGNGQLMIGNGANFVIGSLTAGAGVNIANSAGGITISATGTGTVSNVSSANADIAVTLNSTTPTLLLNAGVTGGVGDAGKVAKLDAGGALPVGMIPTMDTSKLITGTLPIARGGTNSSTALVGNRIMASTASAIVEAAAITANKALISDANGIPTHSAVTNAELGYLSGVTSAVQTQIDGKSSLTGWTNFSAITSNGAGSLTAVPGSVSGSVLNWTVTGPAWTSTVFPTSTTANQLLFSSSNNVVGGLASASNAILTTNGSGVPSWGAVSSDLFTQYAILAGRPGGQTLNGGTAAGNSLFLDSTSNGTKGKIVLASAGGSVGVGVSAPATTLDVAGTLKVGDDGTACSAALAGSVRYNSTTSLMESCTGTSWSSLGTFSSIPGNSVVLMNSCPSGWTDNGATPSSGPGMVTCNGTSCRMCQSPATSSLIPASSILVMESCPASWTSLGAAIGVAAAGVQGINFTSCQSPATASAIPVSARLYMASCPTQWNDLGSGTGPASATCGGSPCHACEVPGAQTPSHIQGALGADVTLSGGAGVTNGNGGNVIVTAGLGNGTGLPGNVLLNSTGNGYVGIGTITPGAMLDVNGTMRVATICDSTGANCKTVSSGWGGLSNFTEAVNTTAPNATTPVVSLIATNAATNVDIALVPKGTGALTANIADSVIAGGNKRGAGAVDWQMQRTIQSQVASGQYSVISGGRYNVASGSPSTVGGGEGNAASGVHSTVSGGTGSTASGNYSTIAGGYSNTSVGINSFVGGGQSNAANGYGSVVPGGMSNTASGWYSFAANYSTTTAAFAQTTFGQYNMPKGGETGSSWTATDPLFVLGNGTGTGASRSNALMILKNGNMGVGTDSPAYKIDAVGDINASGSVRAAGVALTSDARFKKDIQVLDQSLEKILNIRGVSYNWKIREFPERKFNKRHQIGVIAQEVELVFPEVVDTDPKGYKSVNYPALVSPVIEAIKELYAKWTEDSKELHRKTDVLEKELTRKVASLESENKVLKMKVQEFDGMKKALCKKDSSLDFCH